MPRYIDARRITYSWQVDSDGQKHDGVTLQSIIDKIPTADVVEVKHGKWIRVEVDLGDMTTYVFACSNCNHRKKSLMGNYCPNCGAKMDLK